MNFPAPALGFIDQKRHAISHDRQEIGGRGSSDAQVRGFYRPKNTSYHMIVRRMVEGFDGQEED